MMSIDAVVTAGPDQVSVDLNNESVILHATSGNYFGLDEVAQRIWQLVQEPVPVRTIHGTLLEEFDVEPERCKRDLLAFLSELETGGLIRVERGVSS